MAIFQALAGKSEQALGARRSQFLAGRSEKALGRRRCQDLSGRRGHNFCGGLGGQDGRSCNSLGCLGERRRQDLSGRHDHNFRGSLCSWGDRR
jgi:hypothetical protein